MANWKTIKGYSSYEVSDEGNVRRRVKAHYFEAGRPVKAQINSGNGYRCFWLVSDEGEKKFVRANRLVAIAFLGDPPTPKHQVAHNDGSRTNDQIANLRWATSKENHFDKRRHGTHQARAAHPRALLTEEQVTEIRQRYTGEYGQVSSLAREYGMSIPAMWQVCKRRNWQDAGR